MEGFLHYDFGGLIHGGAYFQNFTVCFIVFTSKTNGHQYVSCRTLGQL